MERMEMYVTTGQAGVSLLFTPKLGLVLVLKEAKLRVCGRLWPTGEGLTLLIREMFALRKPAVEETVGQTTRVGIHIVLSLWSLDGGAG